MSKYRLIKTEYRTLESLIKALDDLKIPYKRAANPKQPSVEMYGYCDDLRPERGSIVIDRKWLNENWSGSRACHGISNDLAFAWDGQQYTAIVSDYDQGRPGVAEGMNKLRQRYGYHESMRLLRSKGYTVKSTASDNGQIRVTFVKR